MGNQSFCINTEGSYYCNCSEGFYKKKDKIMNKLVCAGKHEWYTILTLYLTLYFKFIPRKFFSTTFSRVVMDKDLSNSLRNGISFRRWSSANSFAISSKIWYALKQRHAVEFSVWESGEIKTGYAFREVKLSSLDDETDIIFTIITTSVQAMYIWIFLFLTMLFCKYLNTISFHFRYQRVCKGSISLWWRSFMF